MRKSVRKAEKKLMKKAYCGDGLLRYLLSKMYIHQDHFKGSINLLQSNKILARIVINNPDKFYIDEGDKTEIHYLGTVYEAKLFDVSESEGINGAVEFIKQTFKIKDDETPRDIYHRILKTNYEYIHIR